MLAMELVVPTLPPVAERVYTSYARPAAAQILPVPLYQTGSSACCRISQIGFLAD
eukprot:COSAG02_NODE_47347_length_342_cov_0.423868_1_plen_54_part_10